MLSKFRTFSHHYHLKKLAQSCFLNSLKSHIQLFPLFGTFFLRCGIFFIEDPFFNIVFNFVEQINQLSTEASKTQLPLHFQLFLAFFHISGFMFPTKPETFPQYLSEVALTFYNATFPSIFTINPTLTSFDMYNRCP